MAVIGGGETDLDERLRALAHDDRRTVLTALAEADPDADPSLVIGGHGPLDLSASRVELQHRHLPMLAEHGFVVWHQNTLEVVRGPAFHEIEPLIDHLSVFYDDRVACSP